MSVALAVNVSVCPRINTLSFIDAKPGEEWIYATGIRRDGEQGQPICVSRVFINPVLKGIEAQLRLRKGAVYALIEREYGVSIARVDQEMRAVSLDADDAGMWVRAAQEFGVEHPRQGEVVGEFGGARHLRHGVDFAQCPADDAKRGRAHGRMGGW